MLAWVAREGVTPSHHHARDELPLGSGAVFDVKIGQFAGPEMGDIEEHMLTGVDCHFGRLSSRQVL